MGLFKNLFVKEEITPVSDNEVVAVCSGEFIPASRISDAVFAEEMMGKTVAIEPIDGDIVSPVNGSIEVIFPTGHAFGVRANAGTGYLIHIGIDTVSMNGDGFKVLKKQGDQVKAGETIVKTNLEKIKQAGYAKTTMIIITEPVDNNQYNYIDFQNVTKGQIISK